MAASKTLAAAIVAALALACYSPALAYDPSPLQDICVGNPNSPVFINGLACNNPQDATANDFFFAGLGTAGDTGNTLGSAVTPVFAAQLPGLNTMGIGMARLDFRASGLLPPHYHPRATEIMAVLQGQILAGFATSDNRLFTKLVNAGEVFVFPKSLVHFQFNPGHVPAVAISGLSSQNPGVVLVPNVVFGTTPPIPDNILAMAFQLDKSVVDYLQATFGSGAQKNSTY